MTNRAEKRAKKFNHNGGGVIFSTRGMRGNKGMGKTKMPSRANLTTSATPYNREGTK